MQISLQWVNELINIKTVNLEYLIEKLTLGGFEVEEIIEIEIENKKLITLDISATANRSDSLSIKGISKEIATLLNKPYKSSKYLTNNWNKNRLNSPISFMPTDLNLESTFLAVTVENLNNLTSPTWLKQKLISSGIVPCNNLLDFQNYLLLESGYPFEFYDLDKIRSKVNNSIFQLTFTTNTNENKFLGSNNVSYKLDNSILTLEANNLPLSIAGIISHKDFCYTDKTKALLIEGSIFNSTKIRQQSRVLGLRTDRSARYEKSLKNDFLMEALYRLISLLKISNPNILCKFHTFLKIPKQNLQIISLNYKTINEILGPVKGYSQTNLKYISPSSISNYLNRLNFNFSYNDLTLIWEVEIPTSRSEDLTRQIDLIEEIGRLHGFNKFLTRLPQIKRIGVEDYSYHTRKKITACLLNAGFNEFIHYSLVNKTTFLANKIDLFNPLLADCSFLRSSLLPNLLKTVTENLKQGNSHIEGFEYGHVFSSTPLNEFEEKEYVGGIFGGLKTKLNWSDTPEPISWFEGKGKIEQLFQQLNLEIYWRTCSNEIYNQILHPYRTAKLSLANDIDLGIFGQIHPVLARKLNLPDDLYLFEFNLDLVKDQVRINKLTIYKQYSLYPKIVKDLSFIVDQTVSFEAIQKTLLLNGTNFLTEVNLLDEYKGKTIPEKHISLCLQLVFQSNEKTLQNKDVETIITELQTLLTNCFNVKIRI
uniref:Phenylalanine--tRNA ligase beta subunit, chloroplastic n=1 Tax=Nanofrustulum shiloi TaxID=210602 RepID=A0A650G2T1_9STRA|nr:phenylalanine tRNA synthetase [Nanofrustulum shiloi]